MSAKFTGLSIFAGAALALCAAAASASNPADTNLDGDTQGTPSSGAIAADILLMRPLSFLGTVLGTVVFVAGLPIEAITGDFSGPAKRLVVEPAKYTFDRPLGDTGDHQ